VILDVKEKLKKLSLKKLCLESFKTTVGSSVMWMILFSPLIIGSLSLYFKVCFLMFILNVICMPFVEFFCYLFNDSDVRNNNSHHDVNILEMDDLDLYLNEKKKDVKCR
jgi:hypothetical protein